MSSRSPLKWRGRSSMLNAERPPSWAASWPALLQGERPTGRQIPTPQIKRKERRMEMSLKMVDWMNLQLLPPLTQGFHWRPGRSSASSSPGKASAEPWNQQESRCSSSEYPMTSDVKGFAVSSLSKIYMHGNNICNQNFFGCDSHIGKYILLINRGTKNIGF